MGVFACICVGCDNYGIDSYGAKLAGSEWGSGEVDKNGVRLAIFLSKNLEIYAYFYYFAAFVQKGMKRAHYNEKTTN